MTDYDVARRALLDAEIDLMLQRERVAQLRRELPAGPVFGDYAFDSPDGPVRLSSLCAERPAVLYHFMYGKRQQHACPMCSMWADGWNGIARHVAENVEFVVVTAASVEDNLALAEAKGWSDLRILSAADTSFKLDIGGEDADGNQQPFLSVWEYDDAGPRLSWSGGAHLEGEHWRGVDLLSPVWHILDLTRPGRGDWMPS